MGDSDEEFLVHGRAFPADDPGSEELTWEAARAIGRTSSNHRLTEFFIDYAHWALWEGLGTEDLRRIAKSWRAPRS